MKIEPVSGKNRIDRNGFRRVWFSLLLVLLGSCLFVSAASADTISTDTQDDSILSWGTNIPADLSGFFDLGPDPFPLEPDPSLPWTDPQNIATLDYWLGLVAELGNDPSLLQSLVGLGMEDANYLTSPPSALNVSSTQDAAVTPEPVTGALLGAGLLLLLIYARRRTRVMILSGDGGPATAAMI